MSNLTENHWSCNIVTVSVHVTSMPPKSAFHLFIYISASCAVVEKGTGVSRSTIGTTYCFYQVFVSALLTAKPFYLAPNGLFCTKTGFSFQITFHQVVKNVQQQKIQLQAPHIIVKWSAKCLKFLAGSKETFCRKNNKVLRGNRSLPLRHPASVPLRGGI